jgi:hypothetical protein
MQGYLAVLTIVLFLGMVLTRVVVMRRSGIRAVHFGNLDKTDFLVPPFALFYFYTVFAVYGIAPTRDAVYMARWFGVGLLTIGMITWFARQEATSLAGRAIARALTLSYGVGVLLAVLEHSQAPSMRWDG